MFCLSHTFIARRVWRPILLLFEYLTIVRYCCKYFAVRLWTNTVEVCKLCNVFHKSYYSTAIETTLIPFVLARVQYITHWRICCLARNLPFENDRIQYSTTFLGGFCELFAVLNIVPGRLLWIGHSTSNSSVENETWIAHNNWLLLWNSIVNYSPLLIGIPYIIWTVFISG